MMARWLLLDGQNVDQRDGFEYERRFYSPNPNRTKQEMLDLGATEIVPPPMPIYDQRFYYLSADGSTPIPRPIEDVRRMLHDDVAVDRWTAECNGIDWGGHRAQTDRDSRSNYAAMVDLVRLGLRQDGAIYKFADGPAALANADVDMMTGEVHVYVQRLFDHEAEIWAQIEALQTVEEAEAFKWSFEDFKR
jgi:hypothetical protein